MRIGRDIIGLHVKYSACLTLGFESIVSKLHAMCVQVCNAFAVMTIALPLQYIKPTSKSASNQHPVEC